MSKELVISAASHERRAAILEEGQLVEIYIEREKEFALVGSIYKGKVTRVLPGMQSAFVDIGLDGDAFLYVSDVFENLEDHDHLQPHEEHDQPPPLPPAIGSTVEVLPGETLARASERHDQVHHEEFPTRAASDQGQASPEMPHGASEAQHFEEQPGGDQLTPREDHLAQAAEERQPDSNASAPQKFSTQYNPTQNYSNRSGNDRQGQNYGRSGDRGRWGRRVLRSIPRLRAANFADTTVAVGNSAADTTIAARKVHAVRPPPRRTSPKRRCFCLVNRWRNIVANP